LWEKRAEKNKKYEGVIESRWHSGKLEKPPVASDFPAWGKGVSKRRGRKLF